MKEVWEIVPLNEYINLIDYRGRTPKKTESGVRLITAKNVKLGYLKIEPEEFIASDNYESWMTRGIPNFGDVIFTTEAPLANVAQITLKEKLAFAQRIIVMQPRAEKLNQTFLKYLLLSPQTRGLILSKATGATVTGIKSKLLKQIPIPIPPLPEQRAIVALLDAAFAKIDQAQAHIEKNIANARELFQSKLNEIFSQRGEGWEEHRFDDVISSSLIGLVRNSKQQSDEYPFLYFKMNNIKNSNGLNESYYTKIKASEEEVKKYRLNNGDFLFNTRNSFDLVGKSCVFKSEINKPVLFNNNILRVTFKEYLLPEFVAFAFCSPPIKDTLQKMKSGTTSVVGIYYKNLKNLMLPTPSLATQNQIIAELTLLEGRRNSVISSYEKKVSLLQDLKKSLLQKAFAGELTHSDVIS